MAAITRVGLTGPMTAYGAFLAKSGTVAVEAPDVLVGSGGFWPRARRWLIPTRTVAATARPLGVCATCSVGLAHATGQIGHVAAVAHPAGVTATAAIGRVQARGAARAQTGRPPQADDDAIAILLLTAA
jgi:hypothetical protein